MNDKDQMLSKLRDVFSRWDEALAGITEAQANVPPAPGELSLKDQVAHLYAWQQRSIARAQAALHDQEVDYPDWLKKVGGDPEEDVDRTNAFIYETYKDKPWPNVYADWKDQFSRYLAVLEQIPEEDLMDPTRYAWMGGYPLFDTLEGSYDHHEEHLEQLNA